MGLAGRNRRVNGAPVTRQRRELSARTPNDLFGNL